MNAVKVHCISQERWFIRRQRCNCGCRYEQEVLQKLLMSPDPVDEITVKCTNCGALATFRFDISSCSAYLEPMWMKKIEAYSKVMTKEEAFQLVVVPKMENVLGFIEELKNSRDTIGLEFIAEAVTRAQQETKNQRNSNPHQSAEPESR